MKVIGDPADFGCLETVVEVAGVLASLSDNHAMNGSSSSARSLP